MEIRTIPAQVEKWPEALEFLEGMFERLECGVKAQMQLEIASEEIFVNIASYAYEGETGDAEICAEGCTWNGEPAVKLAFRDRGVPYDPLTNPDPDITLSADKRRIGGLGIYMVKKSMDEVSYEYKDGCNVLTIVKRI